MSLSPSQLAATLEDVLRRLEGVERSSGLRYSSLENGSIPVYDSDGALRQQIGKQWDGSYTVVDHNGPPPPVPSTPVLSPALGGLNVTWDGTFADGSPLPTDFKYVEVHVATAPQFTPTDETQRAAPWTSAKGGQYLIPDLAPETLYFVKFVAVNTSLKESAPSNFASSVPLAAPSQAAIDDLVAAVDEAQAAVAPLHSFDPRPTITSNSPGAGQIAWTAFNVTHQGVKYPVAAGNTATTWVTWRYNAGAPTIEKSSVRPVLAAGDVILFSNMSGVGVRIFATTLFHGDLLVDGSIVADSLATEIIQTRHLGAELAEITNLNVGKMKAAYALIGSLTVGENIVWDSSGMVLTHPDGTKSIIPTDGSGPQMRGNFVAEWLTVLEGFEVRAPSVVSNTMTLLRGVTDPALPAKVTSSHASVAIPDGGGTNRLGLARASDGTWITTDTVGWKSSRVQWFSQTTGVAQRSFAVLSGWLSLGGATQLGSRIYVLCAPVNDTAYDRDNWRVLVYDAASPYTYYGSFAVSMVTAGAYPSISNDGANIVVAWVTAAGNAYGGLYSAGVNGAAISTTPLGSWDPVAHITGVERTSVGFATTRWVLSRVDHIYVYTTGGSRVTADEWPQKQNGIRGLCATSDGIWHTFHANLFVDYTNNTGSIDVAYAWRDNNAAGSGYAETKPSPKTRWAPVERARWTISLPSAPPYDGTTDGANSATVYAAPAGGQLRLQATLPAGVLAVTPASITTTGVVPKSVNEFADRPGAVGRIQSYNGAVYIDGNGNWSLSGGQNVKDTGWLNLPLFTGYVSQSTHTPQYRHDGWKTYLSGKVTATGGVFPANSALKVAALPPSLSPPGKNPDWALPGHSAASSVRAYITSGGDLYIVTGATPPVYVSLDGISFWTS